MTRPRTRLTWVKVVEGRLLIWAIPIPDDWKPLTRFDQVGADQQTGDEAVKLFEQHRFLAKGEQFLVKRLEMARQTGHGRSNSMAAIRKAALAGERRCGRAHRQAKLVDRYH
jgi:hypothetical protein